MAAAAPTGEARGQSGAVHLLDVPYIPQTEALCGGAAVAMVLRFWGATGVYAETFADLVDPAAGGIRGEDLVRAVTARGWQALTFAGDDQLVRSHLLKRRPVIALIEDRPGRFHYVVIVGWQNGRVVLHDPARAPFRVLDESTFRAVWQKGRYWTMLALPGSASEPTVTPPSSDAVVANEGPCSGMVQEGVRLGTAGAHDDARTVLEAAIDACPEAGAPWRELAGLRALRGEWGAAASSAREAVRRDPADQHAWRILATSRFLEGDTDGALDAWNRVGEPILDLVNITGLDRTRYRVVADTLGLRPNTLLRARDLQAARRRLAALPSAQGTRVAYVPDSSGRARVDASVLERPVAPVSPVALAAVGVNALADRELRASFASVSGGGELWTVQWRWWERRPRVAATLAIPAPRRLGGTWSLDAYDERQTYGAAIADVVEDRRGAAFRVADWATANLRWHSAIAIDRWRERGTTTTIQAGAVQQLIGDRLGTEITGGVLTGAIQSWTLRARGDWRSASRHEGTVWIARGGYEAAGESAPLAVWPGAGTGPGRDVLLRAHRMLDDGVIRTAVFGRRLVHGSGEVRRWFSVRQKPLRVALAGFVDVARVRDGITSSDLRAHMDVGAGARVAVAGAGVLRVDVARGLRDANTALSIGWTR